MRARRPELDSSSQNAPPTTHARGGKLSGNLTEGTTTDANLDSTSDRQHNALNLGDRLRRHRLAARLSQDELAERAGVSVRCLSDLERGR